MGINREDIETIARRTADEVVGRIRGQYHDSLMLHSVPYLEGSPGIVVNEALAKSTPCQCIEYRPERKLCLSKGVIGALSDEQERIYCPETIPFESPAVEKRLIGWAEAVEVCKCELEPIPKEESGRRLSTGMQCMSLELEEEGGGSSGNPGSGSAIEKPEIHFRLEMNPNYPTTIEPKHRFDKDIGGSPWRDAISATIYLADNVWGLLGYPKELSATIRES